MTDVNAGLAACPCGRIPTSLQLTYVDQGGKWVSATGDCCGEWSIEFRTQYAALDSEECKKLATKAWNSAPRATNSAPLTKLSADQYEENLLQHGIIR